MRLGAPRGLMMLAAMLGQVGAGLLPSVRGGVERTSSDTRRGRQMNSREYLPLRHRGATPQYYPPRADHQPATCDNGQRAKSRRRRQSLDFGASERCIREIHRKMYG